MGNQSGPLSLEDRAALLREDRGDSVQIDEISSVVGSLVQGSPHDDEIHSVGRELKELLGFIQNAKSELDGMQPKSLSKRDIPKASDELDAVVRTTEEAAEKIMDAADSVANIAEELDNEVSERLMDISTSLFEASGFQDLTGQRVNKVGATLTILEERLNALAEAIGDTHVEPDEEVETDDSGNIMDDQALLHGPQMETEANNQDDIDALMASFD